MLMAELSGRRPDGTQRTGRRRRHQPQPRVTPEIREQRERQSAERARLRHEQWLANRPFMGVPDTWAAKADREAEEAAAAGAALKASVRELVEAERSAATVKPGPLRPPLQAPVAVAVAPPPTPTPTPTLLPTPPPPDVCSAALHLQVPRTRG